MDRQGSTERNAFSQIDKLVTAQLLDVQDADVQLIYEQGSQNDLLQLITQPNLIDLTHESDEQAGHSTANNNRNPAHSPLRKKRTIAEVIPAPREDSQQTFHTWLLGALGLDPHHNN